MQDGGQVDQRPQPARSLRRLGFDLKDGERRGRFHITQDGATVETTGDLFGLDLAGVEAWIRAKAPEKRSYVKPEGLPR
jgi:hypothetical protein